MGIVPISIGRSPFTFRDKPLLTRVTFKLKWHKIHYCIHVPTITKKSRLSYSKLVLEPDCKARCCIGYWNIVRNLKYAFPSFRRFRGHSRAVYFMDGFRFIPWKVSSGISNFLKILIPKYTQLILPGILCLSLSLLKNAHTISSFIQGKSSQDLKKRTVTRFIAQNRKDPRKANSMRSFRFWIFNFNNIPNPNTCMSSSKAEWSLLFDPLLMRILKRRPSERTKPLLESFSVKRTGCLFFRKKEPSPPELSLRRKVGVWMSGKLFKSRVDLNVKYRWNCR